MLRPVLLAAAIAACLSAPLLPATVHAQSTAAKPVRNAATTELYRLFDDDGGDAMSNSVFLTLQYNFPTWAGTGF